MAASRSSPMPARHVETYAPASPHKPRRKHHKQRKRSLRILSCVLAAGLECAFILAVVAQCGAHISPCFSKGNGRYDAQEALDSISSPIAAERQFSGQQSKAGLEKANRYNDHDQCPNCLLTALPAATAAVISEFPCRASKVAAWLLFTVRHALPMFALSWAVHDFSVHTYLAGVLLTLMVSAAIRSPRQRQRCITNNVLVSVTRLATQAGNLMAASSAVPSCIAWTSVGRYYDAVSRQAGRQACHHTAFAAAMASFHTLLICALGSMRTHAAAVPQAVKGPASIHACTDASSCGRACGPSAVALGTRHLILAAGEA